MIHTLTTDLTLYRLGKYRGRLMLQLERRKAFRYFIAIFIAVAVIVMAWIVRP